MESGGKEEGQPPADEKEWSAKTGLKRTRDAPQKDQSEPNKPEPESPFAFYRAERRAEMEAKHLNMTSGETNDKLLAQWNGLPAEEKQPYVDAAQNEEGARYDANENDMALEVDGSPPEKKPKITEERSIECEEANVSAQQTPGEETKVNGRGPRGRPLSAVRQDYVPGTSIQIFTDQFLQHSREMESELRRLCTTNTQLKENNELREGHIKNMQTVANRLQKELKEQEDKNCAVRAYLGALREAVVAALKDVAIPGVSGSITVHNADECVNLLSAMVDVASAEHADLVAKVTKQLEEQLCHIQDK